MEGLVILVAEFLMFLLAPLFTALAAFFVGVLELLAAVLGLALNRAGGPRTKANAPPRPRRSWRWLHVLAGLGAVALAGVTAVSFLFLDPALRWGLARVEARTGYAVTYDMARANLLTGTLALTGLRVTRQGPPGLGMDVGIERVAADVDMPSLLFGTATLEDLDLAGVTGRIVTPPEADPEAHPEAGRPAPTARKPRRDFIVERARIARVDLQIDPVDKRPHRIEIITASAEPFRSRTALFDLMFRSNLDARINGIPLLVETAVISDQGRRTSWAFEAAPVAMLADLTGRAPVRWLTGGTVTARVEDEWDLTETVIDMDWRIAFDGVTAAAPDGAGRAERLMAATLSRALARRDGSADFGFSLSLDRAGLAAAGSDDLGALWDALRDGLADAIAKAIDASTEDVRDGIEGIRGRLTDYLDQRGRSGGGND